MVQAQRCTNAHLKRQAFRGMRDGVCCCFVEGDALGKLLVGRGEEHESVDVIVRLQPALGRLTAGEGRPDPLCAMIGMLVYDATHL